ncbi:hypothetical protein CIW83_09490 [Tissierella sp. P1]|uniref:hypothetical protein n=1 Tax=Tissierella sp. P1 TaxID=1280483 RepID=UPI000BA00B71|nr:hypothetical protein [Tissierella sp. P1]OZV12319.1 hypothetical protein CIW83_09490 [Tissierella sp. P1]
MVKSITNLENDEIISFVTPDKEEFLIKYDFKISLKENIRNAENRDVKITETMQKFKLLYSGYSMTITFTPKFNFLGFKRYLLTIGKPIYEIEGEE